MRMEERASSESRIEEKSERRRHSRCGARECVRRRERGGERDTRLNPNLFHVTVKVPSRLNQQTRSCLSGVEPAATFRAARQPWAALPRSPGLEGTLATPHGPFKIFILHGPFIPSPQEVGAAATACV